MECEKVQLINKKDKKIKKTVLAATTSKKCKLFIGGSSLQMPQSKLKFKFNHYGGSENIMMKTCIIHMNNSLTLASLMLAHVSLMCLHLNTECCNQFHCFDANLKKLHSTLMYRKCPCISRTFFHKIEAKNRGWG